MFVCVCVKGGHTERESSEGEREREKKKHTPSFLFGSHASSLSPPSTPPPSPPPTLPPHCKRRRKKRSGEDMSCGCDTVSFTLWPSMDESGSLGSEASQHVGEEKRVFPSCAPHLHPPPAPLTLTDVHAVHRGKRCVVVCAYACAPP